MDASGDWNIQVELRVDVVRKIASEERCDDATARHVAIVTNKTIKSAVTWWTDEGVLWASLSDPSYGFRLVSRDVDVRFFSWLKAADKLENDVIRALLRTDSMKIKTSKYNFFYCGYS